LLARTDVVDRFIGASRTPGVMDRLLIASVAAWRSADD